MTEKKIRGYFASQPVIEGEALVVKAPLDLLSVDPVSGTFEGAHSLAGASVKEKVLVVPCLCGATIAEFIPFFLGLTGNAPRAILTAEALPYTPIMSGCIAARVPLLYGPGREGTSKIRTGDRLRFEAETGSMTVDPAPDEGGPKA